MNEAAIFHDCPKDDAWQALDDAGKQHWAQTVLNNVFNDLMNSGTRPDPWESSMLANAIHAFGARLFTLALANVVLALTPPGQRSPSALLEQITLAELDIAWQHAAVRVARFRSFRQT